MTPGTSKRKSIGVVIPVYGEARFIRGVIAGIPPFVSSVIVVDDASTDDTADVVAELDDPRIKLLRHATNQGLGAAMQTGFAEALRQDLDIVVKMDGDGQMDPVHLPMLLEPLLMGEADMVKGNRYFSLASVRAMPAIRIIGNAGLTFLMKLATGYWNQFDPANGYFAVRSSILRTVQVEKLPKRFFFECGLLLELGILRAVVGWIPTPAVYGDEKSSLSVWRTLLTFPPRLVWGFVRRVFWRYFVHDFSAVSIFLLIGVPSVLTGLFYGFYIWQTMVARSQYTPAGVVMLLAIPIILGFQLILQALVLDVANTPSAPISPPWEPRDLDHRDVRMPAEPLPHAEPGEVGSTWPVSETTKRASGGELR